jgi:hypothetical protein
VTATGQDIIALFEHCDELEMMFIDGRVDFIKQPFRGTLDIEEFKKLIEKIVGDKQRGKLTVVPANKSKTLFTVTFERSLK